MENKSVFQTLNEINVNEHTEKKNGLTYLSWAWAWAEVKKKYPDSTYTIYENKDGLFYHHDGRTAWVKTGVTINGIEHIEYLPVMDYKNASIPLDKITSFAVNTAIQRSLTKAVARHGLGLYIYAGEDLPEDGDTPKTSQNAPQTAKANPVGTSTTADDETHEKLLLEASGLGIDLKALANHLNKPIQNLTNADLGWAIARKKGAR